MVRGKQEDQIMPRTKADNLSMDREIGARLRVARTKQRLSQTTVGAHIGVTFQQVQKYESGVNSISAANLFRLSQFFNKPVVSFLQPRKGGARG
jgi:transcriptional regulator with XRE-family HTH domain